MQSETLYRKTQRGKHTRYEPVAEYINYDSWPPGFHLICVRPGLRSVLFGVEPAHADLLAALMRHREALAELLRKAAAVRPAKRRLTAQEQAAMAAYLAIMGPDAMLQLEMPSPSDILDALGAALVAACSADK